MLHADVAFGAHIEPGPIAIPEDHHGHVEVISQALEAEVAGSCFIALILSFKVCLLLPDASQVVLLSLEFVFLHLLSDSIFPGLNSQFP